MPFSQRNIFYLRTSAHVVLQTILYLDPRDVRWMNSSAYGDSHRVGEDGEGEGVGEGDGDISTTGDLVWGRALSKLKNKIMPKLRAESIEGDTLSSTNKKEKVDIHIEPDFQMAYFFRKVSGKHAVLLKEKSLQFSAPERRKAEAANTDMPPPALPASASAAAAAAPLRRSDAADAMPVSRLATREAKQIDNVLSRGAHIAADQPQPLHEREVNQRKRRRQSEDTMPFEGFSSTLDDRPTPRVKEEEDEDDEMLPLDALPLMQPLSSSSSPPPVEAAAQEEASVDEEMEDKKPKLHVKYSGFKIFGKCFIVVIEPTKRTKRLRPSLFETSTPVEVHQLSATPVPRQARETPVPAAASGSTTPATRRSVSLASSAAADDERSDSRRDRLANGLFRGTPSEYTPTPTPEPEMARSHGTANEPIPHEDEDEDMHNSHSMMLATQMLEGGIAGAGNDIDDD